MATYYELVKQSVLEGLRRANYDVTHFQPTPIRAGLFANRTEIMAAEHSTKTIAQRLRIQTGRGEISDREGMEKAIDLLSAESAYGYSAITIQIYKAAGKSISKYVQEAREALSIMKAHAHEFPDIRAYEVHEKSFRKLIGEE